MEDINERRIFTLQEVTGSIRKTLEQRYTTAFWVKAEMIRLNYYKHSGHCYPDLVEKQQGRVIAQIRANLWKQDFIRINNKFLQVLKEPLRDGIKILFLAKITFDPVYGLSLHIIDIDPSFTLGDLEREKQETIDKLRAAGIFAKNKSLEFPLLPQRIAVISVETSKGYADFLKVIENNPWQYRFFHMLFPSILQGDKAIPGIIGQLRRIEKVKHHFDIVAIIRGGGGDIGLSCYNSFEMSAAIAEFPLPVITGIGHATNETVAEMVGYENAITPTKLAELLIQYFHNFAEPVREAQRFIADRSLRMIVDEKLKISNEAKMFRSLTQNLLASGKSSLVLSGQSLKTNANFIIRNQYRVLNHLGEQTGRQSVFLISKNTEALSKKKTELSQKSGGFLQQQSTLVESLQKSIAILDPVHVLKRGYSITTKKGKAITSADQVTDGEEIETLLFEGKIISTVKSIKQDTHE